MTAPASGRLSRLATPAAIALAAAFLVLFVGGGTRFVIGLTLKPIDADLGGGRGTIGIAVALFLFVSAGFMFVSGRLADRFSLRAVLGGGVAISALGVALLGMATASWQVVLLFGVLYAVGNGLANAAPVSLMLTRLFPSRAGLANAVAFAGMSVGQLVTIAVLAAVLEQSGWRSVYLWLAIAHVVLLPLVVLSVPGSGAPGSAPAVGQSVAGSTFAQALRTRRFWLLAGIYALCGFQDFFVTTHVVAFAMDQGANTLFAGNLLAFMGLTGLFGVLAAGAWSDRSGPSWPALFSFALRMALFALVLVDSSPLSVAVFALAFGFTFLFTAPITVMFTRQAFGLAELGSISGAIFMVHHAAGGVGALLGGVLFDVSGRYDVAFAIMLAASATACALVLAMQREPRPGADGAHR